MKTPRGGTQTRTGKSARWVTYGLLLVVLVGLALLVSGCVRISSLEYRSDSERGPAYKIVVNVRPNNPSPTADSRGVIAFRHPAGWTVESVTYSGTHSGTAIYSPVIAGYYEDEWDATPDDAGHNGPKGGYAWWAGYGNTVHQFASTDAYEVTIIVDTTGMGGDLTFDVVTGVTDGADPTDDANKTFWQLGSLEDDGGGARLDVAVHLDPLVEPTILEMSPADGASNVSPDVIAHVRYSEPVANYASNVFLTWVGSTGEHVPAIVSYSTGTNTVNVDPLAPLTPDREYMLVSNVDVTDLVGNHCEGAHSIFTVEPEEAFVDVPSGAPYYDAIQGMADAGIINGYDNGDGSFSFRPENPVWRWQFAKMIVGALEIPCNESMTAPFTDLDPDDPTKLDMTEFVRAAYDNGITVGTGGTNYSPYLEISRAQVVSMVVRAVQARFPGVLAMPYSGYTNTWGTSFSADHGANARLAEYNGLLAGLPLTGAASNPWGSMSRGEVAQVLWNVMGKID